MGISMSGLKSGLGKNKGAIIGGIVGGPVGAVAGHMLDKNGKAIGDKVFGNRKDSGIFGTGQYRADEYQINDEAFNSGAVDQRQIEFANALGATMGRQAPTMDVAQANEWRARQQGLADNLQKTIDGQTPSVAEQQMQRGVNQSVANAASQAASMRGVSPAMAMRLAQQNQRTAAQDAVAQGGILRAQEQQVARGELGNLSNQSRTSDIQTAAQNQRTQMDQRALNDGMERFFREGQMGMDERGRGAAIERERMKSQNALGYSQVNSGAYQAAAQNRAGAVGGVMSGIAGAMTMFSDERLKTDIQPLRFDSPADSAFKPSLPAAGSDDDDDKFEPTREAASKAKGEDVRKFLSALKEKDDKGSGHQKLGSGLAALGMAMSDKKEKKDTASGDGDVKNFLDALKAYSYEYKEPEKFGEGKQISVMAQDLEKTPVGKQLVIETPEGKAVDYGKANGVMLASQAMLNDRLSEIEDGLARYFKGKGAR